MCPLQGEARAQQQSGGAQGWAESAGRLQQIPAAKRHHGPKGVAVELILEGGSPRATCTLAFQIEVV